jgi:ABC-type enterobactin transport system permease subunit
MGDEVALALEGRKIMLTLHYSARRWQDQVILLLGIWLFVSPFVLGYPVGSPPAINAFIAGAVMGILAAFDLYKTYVWAVIVNMAVGAWTAVSAWLVGVMHDPVMTSSLLIVGVATIVLGLWELHTDPELHSQWVGTGTAS